MENRYSFEGQEQIISPQLVYYKSYIIENIQKMIALSKDAERLWPHVKTHKMEAVVRLQMEAGICKFKCATIAEAEMCGNAGAKKVALAYPLLGPNVPRFFTLMRRFPATEFYAIADDTAWVKKIGAMAVAEGQKARLLMDVDMGQHRTGVPLSAVQKRYREWAEVDGIVMCGMHCYDGHRHEKDYAERSRLVFEVDALFEKIKTELAEEQYDCSVVIMGGTPSFACHRDAAGEYLSPGTCVIQDMDYKRFYPEMDFEPGAALLTRVISRPGKDTFTLDAGTKAVACDPSEERASLVGMEYAKTILRNEEHWVVQVPQEHVKDIPEIGTVMFAIPAHICPTSALYPSVPVVENNKVSDWWEVTARNRKISI